MGTKTLRQPNKWLHRYTILVVLVTLILIYAGGLVTTIGAGLAVPDWPLSFGSLNPSEWWKQPMVREEHGHRLIGATVGLLTLVLCIWLHFHGHRKWLKMTGYLALASVVVQGILGGLRVIQQNIYFAMVHACLAQAFFCILIAIFWGTSRKWHESEQEKIRPNFSNVTLPTWVCISVYIQLIIGSIMRHSGAGMSIPTFPSVFGGVLPPVWTFEIGIHYFHRVWALVVFGLIIMLVVKSIQSYGYWPKLAATTALLLTMVQIFIGAAIILSGRGIFLTTLHVVIGALILAATFTCALWQYHYRQHAL